MLRRCAALFEADRCRHADSLLGLIISDYLAYYGAWTGTHYKVLAGRERPESPESPRRLRLLFIPRLIHNPCLHATVLVRLAAHSPKFMLGLWRTLLIAKHSIDVHARMEIGPGLVLPHPVGIVFGWGVRTGAGVAILQHVTIGGDPQYPPDLPQLCPVIEDGVVIWGQSMVVGPITIGKGAVVGARSWVDKDVAPGAVITGRA